MCEEIVNSKFFIPLYPIYKKTINDMKKFFVTIFAALCCTVMANAEDFIVNGIKYYVTGTNPNTVEVIANENKYSGDIVIPATVTNGETEYSVTRIGNGAFKQCSSLNSVSLPEGLQSIGEFAFSSCGITGLLTIPSTVTNIGMYAFSYCTLSSVSLPEGLQSIGESAFNASKITGELTIPSTVTNIGEYAFNYCALTSVTLLKGQEGLIKTIDRYAFKQCSSLQSVSLPEGVQSIGAEAFSICPNLQSVSLPEGLQSIGRDAFLQSGITGELTIPSSVTSIGSDAFSSCSSLTSVTLLQGQEGLIKTIGDGAFTRCSSLQSVSLPEGLQSIGENAFRKSGITGTLAIPSTVTSIGKNAFITTGELNEVLVYSDNLTTIGEGVWSNSIPTYVTGKSFEKYRLGIFKDYNVKLLPGADNLGDAIKILANLSDAEADAVKGFLKVLGTMGTKQEGPMIEIEGNDASTIKLYNIKNVKFGKEE